MKGIDTNILVRYLVQDEPTQGELAAAYISEIKASGETCFINNIVLCELVWVLKSVYSLSRSGKVQIYLCSRSVDL
ncbi:MAG: PIN domain-containing protein [Nostocaceae cyanobacterium]|nr:PIN domain-containing protein [Nostocaceae cyanobacterium]